MTGNKRSMRQRAAYKFLASKNAIGQSFTLAELAESAGWTESTTRTHLSKHLSELVVEKAGRLEVEREVFPGLDEFMKMLSQVKYGRPKYTAPGYKILELLGEGGFGKVFRSVRAADGRIVAVKFPSESSQSILKRFLREQRLQQPISHPYVARIFEVDPKACWMVMELADHTFRKSMQGPLRYKLFFQALLGLEMVHLSGIVHRDFVPENILVFESTGFPVAKVADFGLAVERERTTTVLTEITPGPRTFGHAGYIAPEQRHDPGSVGFLTDIYSAGIILGEILSGHGFSSADCDELEQPYRTIVEKCLKRKPSDRYQSVKDLIGALSLTPLFRDILSVVEAEGIARACLSAESSEDALEASDLLIGIVYNGPLLCGSYLDAVFANANPSQVASFFLHLSMAGDEDFSDTALERLGDYFVMTDGVHHVLKTAWNQQSEDERKNNWVLGMTIQCIEENSPG